MTHTATLPETTALEHAEFQTSGRGDSFTDVRRACHAWLMRKDPSYRIAWEKNQQHRESPKTVNRPNKFAGF